MQKEKQSGRGKQNQEISEKKPPWLILFWFVWFSILPKTTEEEAL